MILKKWLLNVFFLLMLFQSQAQRKIVVIGKIKNYKSGVSVISDKTGKYYVFKKSEFWDEEKLVGKRIKVWGKLKIVRYPTTPYKPGLPIPQNFYGPESFILNARWKLLKN
jgi:hypothetical protein